MNLVRRDEWKVLDGEQAGRSQEDLDVRVVWCDLWRKGYRDLEGPRYLEIAVNTFNFEPIGLAPKKNLTYQLGSSEV